MSEPTAAQAVPKRRGRRPAAAGEKLDQAVLLKMTAAQRAKLERLGGQPWLREKIDGAKEA